MESGKSGRKATFAVAGAIIAILLFAGVNILSNATLRSARIDLTEARLFTLSEGTKRVLAKLDEPITLRLFYSEALGNALPSYETFSVRVRELLEAYRDVAGGKLRLEYYNPESFSDIEDRAVAYGLQGVPIEAGGEPIYFGIVGTNNFDDEEVMPFIQPEREAFLEYDITKRIHNLSNPKKKVVALLSGLPIAGDPAMGAAGPDRRPPPWHIFEQMTQLFEVKTLAGPVTGIDEDVDVLIVVHPVDLDPRTRYAIDQFVLAGGRALVFVDPHSEASQVRRGPGGRPGPSASSLPELFAAWGIEMVPEKLIGDRLAATKVNSGQTESRVKAVDYIVWLALRARNFDTGDIVMGQLAQVNMPSAGILRQKKGATTEFQPLAFSSEQAMQVKVDEIKFLPDPVGLLNNFKSDNRSYPVAARVRGGVATAFPDGPPKPRIDETGKQEEIEKKKAAAEAEFSKLKAAHLSASRQPVNLIVVADADLLEDRFWVQIQNLLGQRIAFPMANNGDFVINAIDNLTGSDDLIGLRSRGLSARPFEKVLDLRREAENRFRAKEKELQDRKDKAEERLKELQTKERPGGQVILSPEQQALIEKFRADLVVTRKQLRDVQHELRKDIEALEAWLKFINIGLIPIFVALAAIGVGLFRMNRRKRHLGAR